jgi:hypothetical protein
LIPPRDPVRLFAVKRSTRRALANAGAVLLLAVAFVASLSGFRRPPGWVGVAQRIAFAPDHRNVVHEETSENEASTADPVILDGATLERELAAIDAHVRQRLQPDWAHLAPSANGSYIRSRWCAPQVGVDACSSPALGDDAALEGEWIQLDLVRDPSLADTILGYVYRTGVRSGELALTLSMARGGGDVVRPGFSLDIVRADDEGEALQLGTATELRVGPLRCVVNAPGLPAHDGAARQEAIRAELERLLESPSSLRDTVDARLVELLEQAEAALDPAGAGASRCSLQEPVPADRTALLEEARRVVDARQAFVDAHADEIHDALDRALPAGALGSR